VRTCGFQVAVESPPPGDPSEAETFRILFGGVVMVRGDLLMGLRPMAPEGDRFDPDRVGLDHLSFSVARRADLEQAVRLFDEQGVPHGSITRLPSFGIDVLPFEDPTASSSSSPHRQASPRPKADSPGCCVQDAPGRGQFRVRRSLVRAAPGRGDCHSGTSRAATCRQGTPASPGCGQCWPSMRRNRPGCAAARAGPGGIPRP
jgi:glyoxylase I family protein